jgi:hypothetical protein
MDKQHFIFILSNIINLNEHSLQFFRNYLDDENKILTKTQKVIIIKAYSNVLLCQQSLHALLKEITL